jgi:crotonobetainyl-CoA:carnitine CoA-transferase CaiB-like acyl-CoA transferase
MPGEMRPPHEINMASKAAPSSLPMLEGIRICDMTSVIFGPYCTATLASMGAEVIKLEPTGGDELRRVGTPQNTRGMGPAHLTMNAGKRSVTWDLKSAEGRDKLDALLARSDVFIHNLRHEAVARARLDYETVKALRPDIVYVSCTGFASDGPLRGRPAYDDIVQAASGAASLLSSADGNPRPRYLPTAIADKVGGLHAVYAVLGALFHRQRTGMGQHVEVPMFESFTHFLLQEHLYGRTFVPPTGPTGYARQLDPDRQPISTLDGYITIAPYTDERWVRLLAIIGLGTLLTEDRFASRRARFDNLAAMQKFTAQRLATQTTQHWLDLFDAHDIPAYPVNTLDDLFNDPQLVGGNFFSVQSHPTEGDYLAMRPPVRFSGRPDVPLDPAPVLGANSNDSDLDA